MNENETETNRYTLEDVIDECQYYTSPVVMKDCVNWELDHINQNGLIEENETEVHNDEREISIKTENQDGIHSNMNED